MRVKVPEHGDSILCGRPGRRTVFNYDGFTFAAARFHRLLWRGLRLSTSRLPASGRATAFDALASLNKLHGRVRRQAAEPNRPATIVARYFHHRRRTLIDRLTAALGYPQTAAS